ncbi:methylated-DNA--[protein]-cysteine S-methyltransferase [Streptomyces sp. HNM0574]|uniref:methylated-DNA--[protein]-cysteine S-methyltransferase n=1 Tax=Streptomyces sp. HNM0574 TaxID=2714954 RepID=UPI00146D6E1E|nr:methylated-DNA--[protein]-cysteine S-methyltransferase [Streptomyces sp. HNM0574]NLU65901.1 methylated-DNA--[protein]-cysteine S-methyltransferase [Streptomyces sp. HNM0574]
MTTPAAANRTTISRPEPLVWAVHDSPLGALVLTGDGTALASLTVPGQREGQPPLPEATRDDSAYAEARSQLDAYFAGELTRFRLEFTIRGTPFRERVWQALDSIPYGATTTYGELAAGIGASRAAVRAVGGAVGANPLLIVRPCHRVIGADGSLTGYAGGLDSKRRLLTLEGVL